MKNNIYIILILILGFYSCKKDVYEDYVSPERAILFYNIDGQMGETVIKRQVDSAVVIVTVPFSMDLTSIKPKITVSEGATIYPESGETIDFSKDKTQKYTVTAKNGKTREWTVHINVDDKPFEGLTLIPNTGLWESNVKVYSDDIYNDYLTRYSGWNGGDGCYSTLLTDGSLLWTFQDSFFGAVTEDRSRINNTFVRNAGVLEKNREVSSFIQLNPGTGSQSQTWLKYPGSTNDEDDVYWPGRTHVYNNTVQIPMGHLHLNRSTGQLERKSIDIAILSLPDLVVKQIVQNVDTTDFAGFDSGTYDDLDNGYSYFYGSENKWLSTVLHVARVKGHDFTAKWEYLTNNGWQDKPDGYYILQDVTLPNVFKDGGKYYLVSQQIIYGRDIYIFEANSPIGPWINKRTIYKIPERYDGKEILTYNATVHAGLSKLGELVISYNINPLDFWSNFNAPGSADRYRPFFIRVFNWK